MSSFSLSPEKITVQQESSDSSVDHALSHDLAMDKTDSFLDHSSDSELPTFDLVSSLEIWFIVCTKETFISRFFPYHHRHSFVVFIFIEVQLSMIQVFWECWLFVCCQSFHSYSLAFVRMLSSPRKRQVSGFLEDLLALSWENPPPTNVAWVRFPDSASYVGWLC